MLAVFSLEMQLTARRMDQAGKKSCQKEITSGKVRMEKLHSVGIKEQKIQKWVIIERLIGSRHLFLGASSSAIFCCLQYLGGVRMKQDIEVVGPK